MGFGGLAVDLVNSAWIVVLLMVVVFDVLERGQCWYVAGFVDLRMKLVFDWLWCAVGWLLR